MKPCYTYDNTKWLDLLTGFNGEPILYEGQTLVDGEITGDPTSGNPISYFNGTRWEFSWQNGRQLASASTTDGDTTIDIAYTYDINGLRTSKTITRTTTTEEEDEEHTHSYTATVVAPTCTEEGYTLYECECGDSYTDNVVDATGHTYTSTVTAPTCLNAGYTTYTCACGDSYTDNVVDALGHDYVESETETGSVFTCSRCGDSYTGHQHTYTESVVAPTCLIQGYTVYTCSCGDTYMGNYVPALGHDGVVVGQTETMITYLCNRCGATYQEPIVVDPNPPTEEYSLRNSSVSVTTEYHEYIYASGKLLREVITTTDAEGNVTTEVLDFTYDASGYPYTLTYTNGTANPITYYYVVNLQGDVIRLVSANGDTVAEYWYTPYGEVQTASGSMAEINPLRYRGYYYDAESEFYYLQSRYYDPAICRFINADGFASTGRGFLGCNMFAYCNNNPVLYSDTSGYVIELSEDATDEQIQQYERAIEYLKRSKKGRELIEKLENAEEVITIVFVDGTVTPVCYDLNSMTIYFDPYRGLVMSDGRSVQSAAMALAHEMGHVAQYLDGTIDRIFDENPARSPVLIEADNLANYETPIATQLGEPTRSRYSDHMGIRIMSSSTHFVVASAHQQSYYVRQRSWVIQEQ